MKLARPRAALSDILRMHDQVRSRRDGATVSNRNIFNAKTNRNARERKVMRAVRTTSNVPNERRERERAGRMDYVQSLQLLGNGSVFP